MSKKLLTAEKQAEFNDNGIIVVRGFYDIAAEIIPVQQGIYDVIGLIINKYALNIGHPPEAQDEVHRTAVINALVDSLQTTLNLRKLMLHVLAENGGAIAFYLKTRFTRVGRLKGHYYHDRKYRDVVVMEKFLRL